MPAFNLAYEMKAEGIETDVQLTKDDIPVLIHDETLKRTTGVNGFVKDHTLAELKKLDAGSFFSKKYAGSEIITLDEFLLWASKTSLYLNIELKNNKVDYVNLESKVLYAIDKYNLKKQTIISSFNPESVKRVRQLDDKVNLALLRSKRHKNLAEYAISLGANTLHVNYRLLHPLLVQQCLDNNLPLRVYTVNKRHSIYNCLKYQCAGLITDMPDKALTIRNQYHY